ncbi:MAG: M6 family metalloprotease domain-containing protein [Muribaculaceae bacterium]|nr:M6 family metalloprotease domain-containing protein [Muribaculaceae bacterium]
MNLKIKYLAAIAAGLLTIGESAALPARQGVFTVPVADGSQLSVRLVGDEFHHQFFTEDGYPLIWQNGEFRYCSISAAGDIKDSGIRAVEKGLRDSKAAAWLAGVDLQAAGVGLGKIAAASPLRNAIANQRESVGVHPLKAASNTGVETPYPKGPGLFESVRFPACGEQKAIVILVEYKDVKFESGYNPTDYFNRMLNEDNFSDYGATGSAAQYFREQSAGAFRPQFDVYGPVTLSKNMAYYGGNDEYGDMHPYEMVIEACKLLDSAVDFSEYDRNGDGVIDNVFLFYAGRGEANGGTPDTVWPHSANLDAFGYGNIRHDGVRLSNYACTNEWVNWERPDGIGTFVHEFSHVMGLPDLYVTDYSSNAFTPGQWSALDYGPYNNYGMTPPNYGAFERYALGWIKPREVTHAFSGQLEPIADNVAGVIRTSRPNEFFLLENRQQTGWDYYIPGHGMLVWHIDYNNSVWNRNAVNNDIAHQYVDIEEADGILSKYNRDGDTFPGSAEKRSFTASTNPSMRAWDGEMINFPLTEIEENDGIISFNVLGGGTIADVDAPEVGDAAEVLDDSFLVSWTPLAGYDHIINVYTKTAEGDRQFVSGYRNLNLKDAGECRVAGLTAETEYFYTVKANMEWVTTPESAEKSVTTDSRGIRAMVPEALEATEVTETGFTANWSAMELAESYLVSVYTKTPGEPITVSTGFDNGVNGLPAGWSTSATATYTLVSYCGESAPALRLSANDYVQSGRYDEPIESISFWHRGSSALATDKLEVYALTAYGEETIGRYDVTNDKGGKKITVENLPEGTLGAGVRFIRPSGSATVAVDDMEVCTGHEMIRVPLDEYTRKVVDSGETLEVSGLQPDTQYFYTVVGNDGRRESCESNEIAVRTLQHSGVSEAVESVALRVEGRSVICNRDVTVTACDAAGAVVTRGKGGLTLPAAGLYIIRTSAGNAPLKVIIP